MRIVITAGPTREHLDPVRFISNRSTGKMGFALAERAAARGVEVTLIAGPVTRDTPPGVRRVDVVSADDMLDAARRELPASDALIMCAAVADWRPKRVSPVKLKKRDMSSVLELEPTPDILLTLRPDKGARRFVGFAAETGDPIPEAQRKLVAKGLDLLVANDVSRADAGFGADTNRVILLAPGLAPEALPLMSKTAVADRILDRLLDVTMKTRGS